MHQKNEELETTWILVDYGNLDQIAKARGLVALAANLTALIDKSDTPGKQNLAVRLYGGWYEGETLSRLAQDLIGEIERDFPLILPSTRSGEGRFQRITVALARSLLSDPSRDLLHTFRKRGYPGGMTCHSPPFPMCATPNSCPIAPIHDFLTSRRCPEVRCELHPKKIIFRAEQKLVDTMLTTDLIDLATRTELATRNERIVIVSSDDDVWPGIRLTVGRGVPLLHIHTRVGQQTPTPYLLGLPSHYRSERLQ